MSSFVSLLGNTYSYWTVIKYHGQDKHKKALWWCRCECGTERAVVGNNLARGISTSCGCHRKDANGKRTHGESRKSAEYRIWAGARGRCQNPENRAYKNYGGRGIQFSDQWVGPQGFQNFLACVGRRPTPEHTLERINNDGNYAPGNVRWATRHEQNRNKRSNVFVKHAGKMLVLVDACAAAGLNYRSIKSAIGRGMAAQTAFNTYLQQLED